MLEVITVFIWKLEGFCSYSGSLTQLYMGVAKLEAFSPSTGKASATNNNNSQCFAFLWSVPTTDPPLQPEVDESELSALLLGAVFTVSRKAERSLNYPRYNSQNQNCSHTHAFVPNLTQSNKILWGFFAVWFCLGFFAPRSVQNQMEKVMKSLQYFSNWKTVSLMVSDLNYLEHFCTVIFVRTGCWRLVK